jgi:fluoride exporter
MLWLKVLLIGLGGGLGTLVRWGLHEASVALFGRGYAFGILAANVIGCFLLGLLATLAAERLVELREAHRLALTVGFLGGLTTFSTFAYDAMAHAQDGKPGLAAGHVALHLALGIGAVVIGWWLAMRLWNSGG